MHNPVRLSKLQQWDLNPSRATRIQPVAHTINTDLQTDACSGPTSVIHRFLTCNRYYDVLRRAALTITLLGCRVLDVRGYIVLRGSVQNHRLLGLAGRCLGTKSILSRFWGSGWLVSRHDGSRGRWDLRQEVCRLCGWRCGGRRRCYGYCVGLLRLKVLWVSRSCHGDQRFEQLLLWIKRDGDTHWWKCCWNIKAYISLTLHIFSIFIVLYLIFHVIFFLNLFFKQIYQNKFIVCQHLLTPSDSNSFST